jgi:hypothetical protein
VPPLFFELLFVYNIRLIFVSGYFSRHLLVSTSGPVAEPASGGISDPQLMPQSVSYDPELFATTPKPILAASAMNGFDKGLETVYARNATPITDARPLGGSDYSVTRP